MKARQFDSTTLPGYESAGASHDERKHFLWDQFCGYTEEGSYQSPFHSRNLSDSISGKHGKLGEADFEIAADAHTTNPSDAYCAARPRSMENSARHEGVVLLPLSPSDTDTPRLLHSSPEVYGDSWSKDAPLFHGTTKDGHGDATSGCSGDDGRQCEDVGGDSDDGCDYRTDPADSGTG
jgi:putative hemolysin